MIEAGDHAGADGDKRRAEQDATRRSDGARSGASQRGEAAEPETRRQQRGRRAEREGRHRQHRETARTAAGGQRERGAERRPRARRPGQSQQGAERRLSEKSRRPKSLERAARA